MATPVEGAGEWSGTRGRERVGAREGDRREEEEGGEIGAGGGGEPKAHEYFAAAR